MILLVKYVWDARDPQYAHAQSASNYIIHAKLEVQVGTNVSGNAYDFLRDNLVCDVVCTCFGLNATGPGISSVIPRNSSDLDDTPIHENRLRDFIG